MSEIRSPALKVFCLKCPLIIQSSKLQFRTSYLILCNNSKVSLLKRYAVFRECTQKAHSKKLRMIRMYRILILLQNRKIEYEDWRYIAAYWHFVYKQKITMFFDQYCINIGYIDREDSRMTNMKLNYWKTENVATVYPSYLHSFPMSFI